MEIAALGVEVADRDCRPEGHIGVRVAHAVTLERVLEGRRHEAVAVAAAVEYGQVHGKAPEIDAEGNEDEAEEACEEVPNNRRERLAHVAQVGPELHEDADADGGNRKEAHPLDGDDAAETKASEGEP